MTSDRKEYNRKYRAEHREKFRGYVKKYQSTPKGRAVRVATLKRYYRNHQAEERSRIRKWKQSLCGVVGECSGCGNHFVLTNGQRLNLRQGKGATCSEACLRDKRAELVRRYSLPGREPTNYKHGLRSRKHITERRVWRWLREEITRTEELLKERDGGIFD